jgi:hypothetical protein
MHEKDQEFNPSASWLSPLGLRQAITIGGFVGLVAVHSVMLSIRNVFSLDGQSGRSSKMQRTRSRVGKSTAATLWAAGTSALPIGLAG